ncbi:diaminopimelate decarboxylase [Clostridium sp. YIM B02551]|uniref:diaminopimelate decarboxylase n=1 Tax=Clostridium sp. YIM B02551 TaxID=2910679 RepID=UPI001EEC8B29|nr:diaminopimelate decarboxylase [Clostridium sp. YIM B02551]
MKLFGTAQIENNQLYIGGVEASILAKEYGTPVYVVDEELVRNNCRDYYKSFQCSEGGNRVAYAGKAFLTLEMCRIIRDEGLYLDVVSGGELFTALKAEYPAEKIYFHGNNKTIDEIKMGISNGVGRFVVDNLYELEILDSIAKEYGVVQKIYLRITPGIEAHTHEYIKTGQIDSKFGFAPVGDLIFEAIKAASSYKNIELSGLHCHIGSQIFEIEPYEDATEIMLNLLFKVQKELGIKIPELDLGGGFGVYYNEGDEPRETKEYCKAILDKAEVVCKKLGMEIPTLSIEPGRSIIANAGTTLYTIGSIKDIPEVRKYVSVDGGMTDNIRPALYRAEYNCLVVNRLGEEQYEEVTIAGKCCESGDILINDISIPKVESGDILAVFSTGAYGYSMANNYNKIPRPAVIMVSEGKARVICKRESYEDILRNEI